MEKDNSNQVKHSWPVDCLELGVGQNYHEVCPVLLPSAGAEKDCLVQEIIEDKSDILQVDGSSDAASEASEGLTRCKEILEKLLRNQYDQFEVLSLINRFSIELQSESSFSRQKYLLQKHVLECIVREDNSETYVQLLEETLGFCQSRRPPGYHCCLAGCSFRASEHKNYVKHLQTVHPTIQKLACNYKHQCRREFSNIQQLIMHIRECHSRNPDGKDLPNHPPDMLLACKCEILRCGGKKFTDLKLLMKHMNVEHGGEPRECIFDQCSKHFDANSASRHHFRTEHILKKKTKLKKKNLVDAELPIPVEAVTEQEETAVLEDFEMYDDADVQFLELGEEAQAEESENQSDYFLKSYSDFCNRMCHRKYVPHQTMQEISSEFLSQSLKSTKFREKKLRESLRKLPNVTEKQIEEIVTESVIDDPMLKAQKQLDTNYKRSKYIRENFKYIQPQEMILNKDEVNIGKVKECYHYVSVVDSLKNLLEDDTFIEVMEKERNVVREKQMDVLKDVKDGSAYRDVEFFKQNPSAFTLILYSDALELGSHNEIDKYGFSKILFIRSSSLVMTYI